MLSRNCSWYLIYAHNNYKTTRFAGNALGSRCEDVIGKRRLFLKLQILKNFKSFAICAIRSIFLINCTDISVFIPEQLNLRSISNTGYTQKNVAVSKVNKKFISHLTRAQRTPSAAVTVQVSRAVPAVRFSCLPRGRGTSFQDGVAAGKGFLCAPF